MAVAGQAAAVLIVNYGFGFDLPLTACLGVIGASVAVNVAAVFPRGQGAVALSDEEAAIQLGYDVIQ